MALWNFKPTDISYGDSNGGSTENPDDKPKDSKCPSMESTPAFCDPETSGTLKLKLDLDSPSGCNLYPPVFVRIFASDEAGALDDANLIKSFPGVLNQEYTFLVEPGIYVAHLSGKYKSEQTLSASVDRIGIDITGLNISSQPAPDCVTTTPVVIKWQGMNDFEINTEPVARGSSDTGVIVPAVPGSYEIKFFRNGCETVSKFKVQNSNPVSVTVSGTGWTCAGNGLDGRLMATAQGGTAPYTYAWFSGVGIGQDLGWEGPIGFGRTITGLGEGQYMVSVFDSLGCEGTGRAFLEANDNALGVDTVFTSKAKNTICCQDALTEFATLCALATGGYPPYQYLWSDGQTGVCATGLSKGKHFVTVTDRSGCKALSNTQEITITNECLLVKWDFGNGNIQEYVALPNEVFNEVQNTYQLPGNYNVKMMVVNGYQESGIACKNIDVPPCPPLSFIELTPYPDCIWGGDKYPIQYTATMYDSEFGVLAGVTVEVRHHIVDTGQAPYNQPGYPLPPFGNTSCQLTPNVVSGERQFLTSDQFGQVRFARTTNRCECISVVAKTINNPVGLVPRNVSSFPFCLTRNCPSDPGDQPSSSSAQSASSDGGNPPPPPGGTPPPSPPPPSPPPPSPPPPGGGDLCPCCVPQSDGSSRCEMKTKADCAAAGGGIQTLNGLSTGACYGSCGDVPGMITDCRGNVLCREPKGKCCVKEGCVTATPCECEKFGGMYFFSEKGLAKAEEDCNAYCYVSCCYPSFAGCAQSTAVAVGPTRQACLDANGTIIENCSMCPSSSSSPSSPSASSASSESLDSPASSESVSSDSSDYYA